MSDESSQSGGNGNGNGKRTLIEIADKSAENALVRWLARWSMITVVPGLLAVLITVVSFAGGQILEQIKKTGERQESQGTALVKMEAQVKSVAETQLPGVTAILNDRLSAQAERILRIEKLVDDEFKNLKANDLRQNEKLEALMERLYQYRRDTIPRATAPVPNNGNTIH